MQADKDSRFRRWFDLGFFDMIFGGKTKQKVSLDARCYPIETAQIKALAYYVAVDYIASAVSKIEWRTYQRGGEIFGDEYYRWNVRANASQCSADFWKCVIRKLYADPQNGVLIVPLGSEFYIADSFRKDDVKGIAKQSFSDVVINSDNFGIMYADDVIHIDFGDDCRLKSILTAYCNQFEEVMGESISKYKIADGERGILEIDAAISGTDEDQENLNKLLDEDFKTYFSNKNAVLPMYSGYKYTATHNGMSQNTSIVNDIVNLSAEVFAKVGQALKVPPALMVGQTADVSGAVKNFLTFGIDPLAKQICCEGNAVLYGRAYLDGSRIVPDLSRVEHASAFEQSEKIDKLISDGVYSVNEIRRYFGEGRIDEEWADKHYITKNYSDATTEGGENNE